MYLPSKINPKYLIASGIILILLFLPLKNAIGNLFSYLSRKLLLLGPAAYSRQLNEAKKTNLELVLKIRQLDSLKEENARLRKALQFRDERQAALIDADVIAFNPSAWRKHVMIDAGKKKGVRAGLFAVNEDGYFVGKIIEAKENYSHLLLTNDPDFSLPVFLEQYGCGMLKGSLRGTKLLYVEYYENINKGDRIWVNIAGLSFPVYVGKIKNARKDKEGLFWDINVELFVKNPLLHKIFIVK